MTLCECEDTALEVRIDEALEAFLAATTPEGKRTAFDTMRYLIQQRSPTQIVRMERARGLRA